MKYKMNCIKCKTEYKDEESYTFCPKCGISLNIDMQLPKSLELGNGKGMKKYLNLLPVNDIDDRLYMGEGNTPFIKSQSDRQLFFKLESLNPTGAFKDRGTVVELQKALERGYKKVVLASTGNMAASVAAYGARIGLEVSIVVPKGTPAGKLKQARISGANLIEIEGNYDEAANRAVELAEKGYFLVGDYAYRAEGQKTIAYELFKEYGSELSEYIYCPIGNGTLAAAVSKGFEELEKIGVISRVPKMIGIQAEGSAPLVKAFSSDTEIAPLEIPETTASAIKVGNPLDGEKVMKYIRKSGGDIVEVSGKEIEEAQNTLAKSEGFFVENAAATTYAAYKKCKDKFNGDTLLILTGNGLKESI